MIITLKNNDIFALCTCRYENSIFKDCTAELNLSLYLMANSILSLD